MNRILDRLYLGAFADVDGVPQAALAPCTAVLTLCERAPTTTLRRVHYPIPDEVYLGIPAWDAAILLVSDWVMAGETLLVHCRLGVSRGPAVVAGYLALSGYSRDLTMAIATVEAIRPIVHIHTESARGLCDWWTSRPVQRRAPHAQEADCPCPDGAPLVLCDCGTVLLRCTVPECPAMHEVRTVPACGACTATGGQPVEDAAW